MGHQKPPCLLPFCIWTAGRLFRKHAECTGAWWSEAAGPVFAHSAKTKGVGNNETTQGFARDHRGDAGDFWDWVHTSTCTCTVKWRGNTHGHLRDMHGGWLFAWCRRLSCWESIIIYLTSMLDFGLWVKVRVVRWHALQWAFTRCDTVHAT